MNKLELHTNHNVYVLGAGFSADAGLPTIATFMQTLREAGEHYKHSGNDRNAKAIARVLEYRLRAAGAAYRCKVNPDNIEDLFSLIDIEESGAPSTEIEESIRQAIAATIEFSRIGYARNPRDVQLAVQNTSGVQGAKLGRPVKNNASQRILPLYDAYLAALTGMLYESVPERRDTIISFNYDTLVEDALVNLKRPYSYGFHRDQYNIAKDDDRFVFCGEDLPDEFTRGDDKSAAVAVLKLHGSVNWGLQYFPSRKEREPQHDQLLVYRSFASLMASGADRVFVEPPTWRKGYGNQGRGMATIWANALQALRTASRIIVIGYSLPLTDVHFRYLLAAGLRQNISLQEILFVNSALAENDPSYQDMASRIFQILRPELRERGVVRFRGDYLKNELIRNPGMPLEHHKESLFAIINPNAGNRAPPFALIP